MLLKVASLQNVRLPYTHERAGSFQYHPTPSCNPRNAAIIQELVVYQLGRLINATCRSIAGMDGSDTTVDPSPLPQSSSDSLN